VSNKRSEIYPKTTGLVDRQVEHYIVSLWLLERSIMDEIQQYLDGHREAFEDDLCDLLRIPSVSADGRHREDMRQAASWVLGQFNSLGLAAEMVETAGHPIIYAESPPVDGAPIALVYGHYDVQPPDPLDEWISPPFEPTKRDGNVYARGATDDKGQMLTHVKSAQAVLATAGKLRSRQ
jgi:succinyl-diaminopimelate desuccinylase